AYAVMSNHYHLIVRIDRDRALSWDRDEVLRRWTALFSGPLWVQRYLDGEREAIDETLQAQIDAWAETYRERLYDLSWFMRVLNESIAREANNEDGVKGRFWEGRFKSQALLDEKGLLAAMAYVDLNPIRAGIAETPEASDFTSIQERIQALASNETPFVESEASAYTSSESSNLPASPVEPSEEGHHACPQASPQETGPISAPLMPFDPTGRLETAIPFAFDDYLELVDYTGRAIRPDKRGAIPATTPKILDRLDIDPDQFIAYADRLLKQFGHAVGAPENLIDLCAARQTKYLRGIRTARAVFEAKAA
ncbi:MAG: hypothetical protein JXR29_06605, partial [Methylothermaceae bacterium]|nr:hypothetical protein [Methylothermaceae bacterium]